MKKRHKRRKSRYPNICSECRRRIREYPFRCRRCNQTFCSDHRLPEDHNCKPLKEYKKGNKKRWENVVKGAGPSVPNPTTHRNVHTYKPSFKAKLIRTWYRNRRWIKKSIIWIIILVLIYFAFQYYQENKDDIDGYFKNSTAGWGNFFNDIGKPYVVPHENPIDKSYPVYSFLGGKRGINTIELTLHKSVYNYFIQDAERDYSYYGELPDNWEITYWKMFLNNKQDEYVIKDIVEQVKNSTESDGDLAVKSIVLFVQQIPYDWNSFNSNSIHMKYPYEVLYLNKGVCSEKAILMAKLLDELGYGVALFNYAVGDHMAVGIDCPYDKSNYNSGYCFIEPSDVYPIGQIPMEYVGGADIRNEIPSIITISQGKSYSK